MNDQLLDFVIVSHGRQASNSLYCDLNNHPQITVPNFDQTDPGLIDGKVDELKRLLPRGDESTQQESKCLKKQVNGIIFHGFSRAQELPGNAPKVLANLCRPSVIFFLFVRNPVSLLQSSYRTYLQYWLALEYFKKAKPRGNCYQESQPVEFLRFVQTHQYLTNYNQQIQDYSEIGARWVINDFQALCENYRFYLSHLSEHIGISQPFVWPRLSNNQNSDLMLEQIFSFSRKNFDTYTPMRLGLFRCDTSLKNRGQMTQTVGQLNFEGKQYDVTIHIEDKKRYQPDFDLLANDCELMDKLLSQFWHFKNYVFLGTQYFLSLDRFNPDSINLQDTDYRVIKKYTQSFIAAYPQFSSWEYSC